MYVVESLFNTESMAFLLNSMLISGPTVFFDWTIESMDTGVVIFWTPNNVRTWLLSIHALSERTKRDLVALNMTGPELLRFFDESFNRMRWIPDRQELEIFERALQVLAKMDDYAGMLQAYQFLQEEALQAKQDDTLNVDDVAAMDTMLFEVLSAQRSLQDSLMLLRNERHALRAKELRQYFDVLWNEEEEDSWLAGRLLRTSRSRRVSSSPCSLSSLSLEDNPIVRTSRHEVGESSSSSTKGKGISNLPFSTDFYWECAVCFTKKKKCFGFHATITFAKNVPPSFFCVLRGTIVYCPLNAVHNHSISILSMLSFLLDRHKTFVRRLKNTMR